MAWWTVFQVAVAIFSVASTIKAKREFKKQQSKLNKNRGFEINRFGQDEPLYFVAGTRRVGPTFVYRTTKDTDDYDGIPNERYASLMVWGIGKVEDFKNLELNDQAQVDWNLVETDWSGGIIDAGYGPTFYTDSFYYNNNLTGGAITDSKAYISEEKEFLLQIFRGGKDANEKGWTEFKNTIDEDVSDVHFNGLTFSTLRIFLTEGNSSTYSSGEPKFTAEIKGPQIRRTRGTDEAAQMGYSENPIDQVYWYLLDSTIGKGLDESQVNRTAFIAMTDYCNELITTPDGDKPRFTSNYIIDTSQTHKEIIDDILMGCHARLIDDNGVVSVDIDRPKTPMMDFDEEDLVERINSSIQTINDRFNEVIIRFPDKETNYHENEVSFPDRTSQLYTDWLDEDKGKQLIEEIELPSVTDYYEALRFAEYVAYKSRNSRSVTCAVGAVGLQLEEGDVITLSSSTRGWVKKPFIVEGITLKSNMVGLELIEYNAEVYSFVSADLRTPTPTPTLKNPFAILPVTNLQVEQRVNSATATWDFPNNVFVKHFKVKLTNTATGATVYEGVIRSKSYDFLNLSVGNYTLKVFAVNNNAQSAATTTTFDVALPSSPTNLIVTDSYIEWQHPNLADVREFIIETTENTSNDTVAHSQPPSSNGIQRLEIAGIKAGDYDVSVTAKGLNNLLSLPATLTNAQIDGITPVVTPIINDAIGGFTNDPHTWSALNNFVGGLQKNGIDVNNIDENNLLYVTIALAQVITGSKNFTGGLLKNGSPVIGLEDLTYNSDESLAIAATTIEQFYKDQEAGLYDDFDTGVGSLAAGFVNSIINQANFLIANNANIDKLKSSAIEVSGSGYALNQNPTWQDTLDGWIFESDVVAEIKPPSVSTRVANQVLQITTTQNDARFFGNFVPIARENTYTISVWALQTGTAKQYFAVSFYDANNNILRNETNDSTGWLAKSSYNYFGVANSPISSSAWQKYEVKMGLNGDASIPTGAVSCRLGMLVNFSGDYANTTVYLQDYRIEKSMGGTHIENGVIETVHVKSKSAFIDELTTNQIFGTNAQFTGDLSAAGGTFSGALSAASGTFNGDISGANGTFTGNLSGSTITGGKLQTASDTSQRVIVQDDGTYLLWAGNGAKNDTNATFFIKANGTGFVKGEFFQGEILETASQNGSFTTGSPWSITASGHQSAGKSVKIDLAASFNATFTGNKTTENYTLICTIKRGTTTIGTRTFYNAPAFYNSINQTTDISITGQSFVTDSNATVGTRSYTLEVSLGGGGGTYNNVDVDLSIYTLENKLES